MENNGNSRTVAFTIFVMIILLAAVGVGFFLTRDAEERAQFDTSDAGKLQILRLVADAFDGYFFWRSPEMKKQLPRAGYSIDFTDDGGAYADRVKKFADGQYDAMLLPIGEYLLHGKDHNFPGVVVAAISDSKGMDGIVGLSLIHI